MPRLAAMLFAASLCAGAQPSPEAAMDRALRAHAKALLDRFGDTFYVLGAVVDTAGQRSEVATRHWPELSAHPDEWRDSIVAALRDEAPRVTQAGFLVDRWRQIGEGREDSTVAVFHFETRDGRCVENARRYDFGEDGTIRWSSPPIARPCQPLIWRPARG